MRILMIPLLCAAVVPRAAHAQKPDQQSSELCSIRTVAVVGDNEAANDTRKRVEKKTWMKRWDMLDEADGILDVQIVTTSFSVSISGDQVTSASREGDVVMQLRRRQSERVLWERRQALGTADPIDNLLTSLQRQAGCRRH